MTWPFLKKDIEHYVIAQNVVLAISNTYLLMFKATKKLVKIMNNLKIFFSKWLDCNEWSVMVKIRENYYCLPAEMQRLDMSRLKMHLTRHTEQ